jgi:hypothetical protein
LVREPVDDEDGRSDNPGSVIMVCPSSPRRNSPATPIIVTRRPATPPIRLSFRPRSASDGNNAHESAAWACSVRRGIRVHVALETATLLTDTEQAAMEANVWRSLMSRFWFLRSDHLRRLAREACHQAHWMHRDQLVADYLGFLCAVRSKER